MTSQVLTSFRFRQIRAALVLIFCALLLMALRHSREKFEIRWHHYTAWTFSESVRRLGFSEKRLTEIFRENLKGGYFLGVSPEELARHLLSTCQRYRMDPALVLAVIEVESRFHASAISNQGALGLMQVRLDTANDLVHSVRDRHPEALSGRVWLSELDILDPKLNITLGVHYLAELKKRYQGVLSDVLGAYNMGPGRWNQILQTRGPGVQSEYAKKVKSIRARLRNTREAGVQS